MRNQIQQGFHGFHHSTDELKVLQHRVTMVTYKFENFFHPFVGELTRLLNEKSLAEMLDPKNLQDLTQRHWDFFTTFYDTTVKTPGFVVLDPIPQKKIDLDDGGPYANYNWELLFHIPLTIAVHLSKNQRFAEARRWFHYIFDPTSPEDPSVQDQQLRFWKFLGFRLQSDVQQIDKLLELLSMPENEQRNTILAGYNGIMANPFQPHLVASTRPVAYQYYVLMKYLDNLIAWGDSLFMQDTVESINEATQLYVLAANLLGPRPQQIPSRGTVHPMSFAQLKKKGLSEVGDALVDLEAQFPFNSPVIGTQNGQSQDKSGPLFGIGSTLYFCVPRNDKLLGYWDTVADRLFKIRHCMNIEGVVRQLALFDPPLDPGMLIKAAAAGIDIGSIVGGLNQPVGPVRTLFLIQKALELSAELRGLGSALLSAIEKGDSEQMALLRQGHEIKIQQLSQEVRFLQWKQAQEATESLLRSRASALERYRYHLRSLGLTPDSNLAPDTFDLDRTTELTEENFDQAYATLVGNYDKDLPVPKLPALSLPGGASPGAQSGAWGQGLLFLNPSENAELNEHLPDAKRNQAIAFVLRQIAPSLALIPGTTVNFHYWGIGGTLVLGGPALTENVKTAADVLELMASRANQDATSAAKTGSYQRRADDWMFQVNLAARELMQIGRQLIGSLIAEQVAHHDYLNTKQQIENSQEVDRFLHEKFSNQELYAWMQGEISRLYYEYYRFAFDTARRAERTMKQELMRPELDGTDFVKFNYWDGGRKGLLSGEALYLDVKRMEMAYHDSNQREFELTRHVSLRQLDPLALLNLRVTGKCEFSIPEWLYDLDCPGHYMRRIKTVAVSLPSVVGPYTSVNCTLSLLRSTVRKSPLLSSGNYGRDTSAEDGRFVDYFGSVQSIVTSSGNNDSGMFETNLRDERFLPFEGAGAESAWRLELPDTFRQFDYSTISDVVLHVRYTARQGGTELGSKAINEMQVILADATKSGLALLFSLQHDFPTEWSTFAKAKDSSAFSARLRKEHFPYLVQYLVQSEKLKIDSIELYTVTGDKRDKLVPAAVPDASINLDDLNGAKGFSTFSLNRELLRPDASSIFLLIRYSIVDAL